MAPGSWSSSDAHTSAVRRPAEPHGRDAGVTVHAGVDWFEVRGADRPGTPVLYTRSLDRWFDFRARPLSWRTPNLQTRMVDVDDYQGATV